MADQAEGSGRLVRFKKGERLFAEYENSQDFFIIKSGGVKIFRMLGAKEVVLDTVGPGMVAGEISSIDNGARTATGVALSDTEVIKISKEEFQIIFSKIPDWFRKIALILVQRLREVDDKISRAFKTDHTNHIAALIALISYSEKCKKTSEGFEFDRKFLEYEAMDILVLPLSEVQTGIEKLISSKRVRAIGGSIILAERESCEKLAEELNKNIEQAAVV